MWQAIPAIVSAVLSNRKPNNQQPNQWLPGQDNLGHLGSSSFRLPDNPSNRSNGSGLIGTISSLFNKGNDNG